VSVGTQVCQWCGEVEEGRTGPANRYLCTDCYRDGWRLDSLGNLIKPEEAP